MISPPPQQTLRRSPPSPSWSDMSQWERKSSPKQINSKQSSPIKSSSNQSSPKNISSEHLLRSSQACLVCFDDLNGEDIIYLHDPLVKSTQDHILCRQCFKEYYFVRENIKCLKCSKLIYYSKSLKTYEPNKKNRMPLLNMLKDKEKKFVEVQETELRNNLREILDKITTEFFKTIKTDFRVMSDNERFESLTN